MPVATRNADFEHFDLKTLPEAYVKLRRMTYGQILERRAMMKVSFSNQGGKSKNLAGEIAMANKAVQIFEFAHCVVEHNLEDDKGRTLNLSTSADVERLDPKVGQEIETLIEKLNNFDQEDDDPNSSGE